MKTKSNTKNRPDICLRCTLGETCRKSVAYKMYPHDAEKIFKPQDCPLDIMWSNPYITYNEFETILMHTRCYTEYTHLEVNIFDRTVYAVKKRWFKEIDRMPWFDIGMTPSLKYMIMVENFKNAGITKKLYSIEYLMSIAIHH